VACDELLFIPGTPLEDERLRHGPIPIDLSAINSNILVGTVTSPLPCRMRTMTDGDGSYVDQGGFGIEMAPSFELETDENDDYPREQQQNIELTMLSPASTMNKDNSENVKRNAGASDSSEDEDLMRKFLCGCEPERFFNYRRANTEEVPLGRNTGDEADDHSDNPDGLRTLNWAYSPSGASVLGAALDVCLPVLLNFHLFISALNHPRYAEVQTPKIFPLMFLTGLTLRCIFPRGKRKRFWGSLVYTVFAPLFRVNFRDEIIGEVATSMARPIQDVVFAYFYYFTVIIYGVSNAAKICEDSRFLHVIVLPTCAIFPLWLRFLQTLRQSRDAKRRWPYLGNSIKYFTAAMIVLYDMGHPTRGGFWWAFAFFCAVLYQIWWDTFMDWELFVIVPKPAKSAAEQVSSTCIGPIASSFVTSNTNRVSATLAFIVHVCSSFTRKYCFCYGDRITLRSKRLYESKERYWAIFFVNAALRFCWMLSFIPAKHITASGEVVHSFSSDVQSYVGPVIASAEIVRRCLWGILRLELESIKLYRTDDPEDDDDKTFDVSSAEQRKTFDQCNADTDSSSPDIEHSSVPTSIPPAHQDTIQSKPGKNSSSNSGSRLVTWSDNEGNLPSPITSFFSFLDKTHMVELYLWAAAFLVFGYRALGYS